MSARKQLGPARVQPVVARYDGRVLSTHITKPDATAVGVKVASASELPRSALGPARQLRTHSLSRQLVAAFKRHTERGFRRLRSHHPLRHTSARLNPKATPGQPPNRAHQRTNT